MKTVFINGSPKKKLSVSAYLLRLVRFGVKGEVVNLQLRSRKDHAGILESIRDADAVVLGMPLYVDGVPSHVLSFLKDMERFCIEHDIRLKVYALSNGGFIEGCQNKPLMMVLENFCKKANLVWCGGVGIGGGVMVNVMRIMFYVNFGIFALNVVISGVQTGNWLPMELVKSFADSLCQILILDLGVFFYSLRMGSAINKGTGCGVKFTRVLLPSFVFILAADLFFVVISFFQGRIFRGWLSKK